MRRGTTILIGALVLALLVGACGSDDGAGAADDTPRPENCLGKCDGQPSTGYVSPYVADLDKMMEIWPGDVPITKLSDAFTVIMKMGDVQYPAPTHLFGVPVNVIPYSNEDKVNDASGTLVLRGDAEIAKAFPPGWVGYAVKHHRPEYRSLDVQAEADKMKEHFKLQDTHIELVVGVNRGGAPGAITINNPQGYENGRFGTDHYPMVFVRPAYPDYLDVQGVDRFNDNIRTMMVAFNTVSNFPGNYNGGDPLAAHSVERVKEHTTNMVKTVAGDEAAVAWFDDPLHQVYCAELAHVATSAGLIVPLNAATMVPLAGQEAWDAFVAEVDKHNTARIELEKKPEYYDALLSGELQVLTDAGIELSNFALDNENKLVALVEMTLAPEDLLAAAEYAPADQQAAEREKIAFKPMTMADIVEQFLRTHVPRELLGESMAPVQGQMLQTMKPGLLEAMSMDQLPAEDPRRVAVDGLFAQLVEVVSTPHADYAAFRTALAPLMEQARTMTGPRDETGTGYFVPPSLLHVIAQGKHLGGMMGLSYVGHGIHYKAVRNPTGEAEEPAEEEAEEPAEEEPGPTPEEPYAGSCTMTCGLAAPDDSCYCDEVCLEYEDCCDDFEELCQ